MIETQPRYPRVNLGACLLPWTEDFKLDEKVFEKHIRATLDGNYKHIYLMGTAGEGYALNEDRFRQVVEIFASLTVRDGITPQIGVIGLSMEQIIDRLAFAYDKGIRMFQISLPSWGVLDESETMIFFKTVCGSFPDSMFLHYNLARAKRIINGAEYHRIAEEVPNLVATKNSSSDYVRTAELMHNAPELRHFLLDFNFAIGCTFGPCGLLCGRGAAFPQTTWKFYEAGLSNNIAELFRVTRLFWEFTNDLFVHLSRRMIDGSYDKMFVWFRDESFPYRMLPPYIGANEEEARMCREMFEKKYKDIP